MSEEKLIEQRLIQTCPSQIGPMNHTLNTQHKSIRVLNFLLILDMIMGGMTIFLSIVTAIFIGWKDYTSWSILSSGTIFLSALIAKNAVTNYQAALFREFKFLSCIWIISRLVWLIGVLASLTILVGAWSFAMSRSMIFGEQRFNIQSAVVYSMMLIYYLFAWILLMWSCKSCRYRKQYIIFMNENISMEQGGNMTVIEGSQMNRKIIQRARHLTRSAIDVFSKN
jgi:hypothetical protein